MANLAMIRARKGLIIAIASEGDTQIEKVADDVFYLPKTLEPIYPLLATIRSSSWPTTSPSPMAATLTSQEIWPRA